MSDTNQNGKYSPVPFTAVTIQDEFWAPKLEVNRARTLPIEYQQLVETGRIDAFRLAAERIAGNAARLQPGEPAPHIFWSSDIAKWIEAASYSLATYSDEQLAAQLDQVIDLIVAAQEPDGYLNPHFTVAEPEARWTNLRDRHELYCAGHLMEAGVAHFQATGKRSLLDVVCRFADYIDSVFGRQAGQLRGYSGHEEIELALVKLYHVTGEQRYLALSQYFIDERGSQPHYFDQEAIARGEDPKDFWAKDYAYMQAHIPVRQQDSVVGHAVRAMYLYAGMADVANETGDRRLRQACEKLWEDVCLRKMYLTGGIGPSRYNEGFTRPYDLPNETAYAETCAAVGLILWNQRMLQFDCDSRYADVMERALYNGALSGVSLDGERFFYENPLASLGDHHRQAWFDCACCPPNIARLLASLGGYIYSQGEEEIAVHLYVQGSVQVSLAGQEVTLSQETRYPWDGKVTLQVQMAQPGTFGVKLRLPGWCQAANLAVNDEALEVAERVERGYVRLERTWQPGDVISFEMEMPIERVYAHPLVRQDIGQVALQRGPLVYCLEQADHMFPLERLFLPRQSAMTARFSSSLLGGVVTLTCQGLTAGLGGWQGKLYRTQPPGPMECILTAIPYYAWDNRQAGQMRVWLPESAHADQVA